MKKIVIASDSFKGTLSSQDIINIAKEVIKERYPSFTLVPFLIADGGEGTVDAFSYALNGRLKTINCHNANGEMIEAHYFLFENKAIIEVASAISLPNTKYTNPFFTSSLGVGEIINDAISEGAKEIIIGLGGSSTNDGGAPILKALGAKFYDEQNNEISDLSNHNLSLIKNIDFTNFKQKIHGVKFVAMCDVVNPLLGKNGATYVYSKQKGANESDFPLLEQNLAHFASISGKSNMTSIPGTGAAGGIGFGLLSFFSAKIISGINVLLDLIKFEDAIKDADMIISGEGRLDEQSFNGKVIDGILKRLEKHNKNLELIVGCIKNEKVLNDIYKRNINNIVVTSKNKKNFDEIVKDAKDDYKNALISLLDTL